MTEKVAAMLRMSLDALVNLDADIAFKATNIAEEVIYMVEGEIVRHADY
jgi:phosphate uptake regulator